MKNKVLFATLLASSMPFTFNSSFAQDTGWESSANVGVFSEYRFRGVKQTEDAPAIQGGFDSQKTWKDYILENETNRVKDFEEEHWKMLDGKYDGVYNESPNGNTFSVGSAPYRNEIDSGAFDASVSCRIDLPQVH